MSGFQRRQLGKTGLMVSPLGIGGGNSLAGEDLLYAFHQGINYFFFSSDLHHACYGRSAAALRTLCQSGSSVRDQVVLATVTYILDPEKLPAVLLDLFSELRIEYIDVFHWGWITDQVDMLPLIKSGLHLKNKDSFYQGYRHLFQVAEEASQTLLRKGLARHIGFSFHARAQARAWMRNMDVMMLRYNLAHLGAEEDIVPFLSGDKDRDPGIVLFNVAHEGRHFFHMPPPGLPEDIIVPSLPDCYRFALSNPWADLVLTGPMNRRDITQALAMLDQGPMDAGEIANMRAYAEYLRAQSLSPR